MESLFDRNGLVVWTEREIRERERIVDHCRFEIRECLREQNKAWEFLQVETSQLMPSEHVNEQYKEDNSAYVLDDSTFPLALRPETTFGSYTYAQSLLDSHSGYRLPLCIWQHGKSFRREQDFPLSKMRLKEFYQLEFQCIYSPSTKCDYSEAMIPCVQRTLSQVIGPCRVEPSDRIPAYAEWTQDIVCEATDMEVCSISLRKDFPDAKVLEVAIGTDRCVYNRPTE